MGRTLRAGQPYLLSLPSVAFLAALFLLPLIRVLILSVTVEGPSGLQFTLEHFEAQISQPLGQQVLIRTLRVALISTLLTLVVAYPLALFVREVSARWRTILMLIALAPLLTSNIVRSLAWVLILRPGGFLQRFTDVIGLPSIEMLYTEAAIILGTTYVLFGYMFLSLLSGMTRVRNSEIEAAFGLGASRFQVIRRVVFPLTLPGVVAGSLIVFTLAAGQFAMAAILGGFRNPVLGTQIYREAIHFLRWDRASAYSVVLLAAVSAIGYGIMRPLNRRLNRGLS